MAGICDRRWHARTSLLSKINEIITKAEQDGTLARLFEEATQEFERAKGFSPGSRKLRKQPWECLSQTAKKD